MPAKGLAPVALLALALWSCQQNSSLYDFDDDGSLDEDDCAPSDPLIHPAADDPYGDGIDQNCDGVDGNAVDLDGDGYSNAVDCDDNNADIHPGAEDEPGDGIDSNCDGVDGVAVDEDGDGYSNAVDCDDSDPAIYPGATDTEGDGVDQNCDGVDGVAPSGDDDDDSAGDDDDDSAGDDDDDSAAGDDDSSGDDDTAGDDDDSAQAGVGELANLPPTSPVPIILPVEAYTTQNLYCAIDVFSSDPDGDTISYRFDWFEDSATTTFVGPNLPATATALGAVWTCVVTPSDALQDGIAGSVSVTISAPVACLDGTVESGETAWGRQDIAFCADSQGFTDAPGVAEGNCGVGWTVCTAAQFMSRNDLFDKLSGNFHATIDDGSDCQVLNSTVPATYDASSDYCVANYSGSCSQPCSHSGGDRSRYRRIYNNVCLEGWSTQGDLSLCGVLCCID